MVPLPPSSGLRLRWTIFCPDWMHLPTKNRLFGLYLPTIDRYFSMSK
jgi:hypothetical protein